MKIKNNKTIKMRLCKFILVPKGKFLFKLIRNHKNNNKW